MKGLVKKARLVELWHDHPEFDLALEVLADLPQYIPGQGHMSRERRSVAWPAHLFDDYPFGTFSDIIETLDRLRETYGIITYRGTKQTPCFAVSPVSYRDARRIARNYLIRVYGANGCIL